MQQVLGLGWSRKHCRVRHKCFSERNYLVILAQSGLMTQYQFVSIQCQKNGNRKTRSLLKSQSFSSLSGYSWNFNLQTSHTHLCTLVLYPVSWGDPGKCIMHTAPSHIQLLLYLSSWALVFFSSPRDFCASLLSLCLPILLHL